VLVADPPSHVSFPEENEHFSSKYVVATNDLRKHFNYECLASFSPVLKVNDCDADVCMMEMTTMTALWRMC
jgi:hypothetical protein